MINIVIVDDDVLALTKLKSLINLKNTKVSGEYTQPEDALSHIRKHRTDILLTDMRMPKIDGIELIRQAREINPAIQVVAISSYKDFDYVKESFKEGSLDYILKHMLTEETLTHALLQACEKIRERQSEENRQDSLEILKESRGALRSKIFTQLLRGEMGAKEAADKFRRHGIPFDLSSASILVCEIDDYQKVTERFGEEDKRIFLNALWDIMDKVIQKAPEKEILSIQEGRYAIILSFTDVKSQLYILSRTQEYAKRLNENIRKMMNIQVSVGMDNSCSSMEDLVRSYHKCLKMLENKFFEGKGQVYSGYEQNTGAARKLSRNTGGSVGIDREQFVKKLTEADESYREDLNILFEHYKEIKLPIRIVELSIVELLNLGYSVIKERQLGEPAPDKSFPVLYQKIKKTETVDEIREILMDFYDGIVMQTARQSQELDENYSKYTAKAVRYIYQHYMEPISQQDVAGELGIHYAYLSKIFREDTGCNFTEYLNRIRIEKAKQLIAAQEYKIKEIYSMVGYNQYNYFFKVFKQQTGCTPSDYEEQILKK